MSNSTETPLSHEAAAREMMSAILAVLATRLPGASTLPKAQRRRIISVASLPDDFLETIAVTVETSPELGAANRLSPSEVRDVLLFSRVYLAFADQLTEVVRGIRTMVAERRYEVGQKALGVYGTAKSINRPNQKDLVPNVATMRRALARGSKKPADGVTPPPTDGGAATLKK